MSIPPSPDEKRFRISFAELQRVKVRKLQCRVVSNAVSVRIRGCEVDGWETNLEKYAHPVESGSFLATGEYFTDNYVLNHHANRTKLRSQELRKVDSVIDWETKDS
ncbi:hypothetical protein MMYC01_207845 [Madurella mycetomatis]|uniref:Uncharacterized protein n=1 Tax=Madurella mycetomatis TaxID=100816 RepID=A0A175VZL1_9PEZI|nr:hypothetical protein MMYC01_207845 [Madurella mycetomatis]